MSPPPRDEELSEAARKFESAAAARRLPLAPGPAGCPAVWKRCATCGAGGPTPRYVPEPTGSRRRKLLDQVRAKVTSGLAPRSAHVRGPSGALHQQLRRRAPRRGPAPPFLRGYDARSGSRVWIILSAGLPRWSASQANPAESPARRRTTGSSARLPFRQAHLLPRMPGGPRSPDEAEGARRRGPLLPSGHRWVAGRCACTSSAAASPGGCT